MEAMNKQEAIDFFSQLYNGEHHIPGFGIGIKEFGQGWYVVHDRGGLATFDFSQLTKFVVLCHDNCVRGEILPYNSGKLKLVIWKRKGREGNMSERHPDLETNVEQIRSRIKNG